MKKTIYLMRHGETYFNKIGKIQGWCDSPVTDLGIKQAEYARDYFESNGFEFDSFYTSKQSRAIETLEIITNNNADYQEVLDLREWGFGRFESESSMLMPRQPFEDYFVQFGGESQSQARSRFNDAMIKIAEEDPFDNILIVSHGTIVKEFSKIWTDNSEIDTVSTMPNCSVLVFEYHDNQFTLKEHIIHDFPEYGSVTTAANFVV